MEHTVITSVGIDVGTTTTQVIFARLHLENTAGYFSAPHVAIVEKEIIYRSQIFFTPLFSQTQINVAEIKQLVEDEYLRAGFLPGDVDTGAVIITGESARKENAALILQELSNLAGEFVVSTAGPDLESILAGKGSGAQQYSEKEEVAVVNLDIGGGTTNLACFDCGESISKGCLDLGGRLIRISPEGMITFVSPAAEQIARSLGFVLKSGDAANLHVLKVICRRMAELLEEILKIRPQSELLKQIQTGQSSEFRTPAHIHAVCFSGGVADCICTMEGDPFRYGDIGPLLGEAIYNSRIGAKFQIINASETIRATVIGAGSYSTTVSGSTITQTEKALPLKNIPVLKLNDKEQGRCYQGESLWLADKIKWFLEQNDEAIFLLAMKGIRSPSWQQLEILAQTIAQAMDYSLLPGIPVLVALEYDTAKVLGQSLKRRMKNRDIVCIDGIRGESGDYIDLGRPLMGGMVVPVVIKTLALG